MLNIQTSWLVLVFMVRFTDVATAQSPDPGPTGLQSFERLRAYVKKQADVLQQDGLQLGAGTWDEAGHVYSITARSVVWRGLKECWLTEAVRTEIAPKTSLAWQDDAHAFVNWVDSVALPIVEMFDGSTLHQWSLHGPNKAIHDIDRDPTRQFRSLMDGTLLLWRNERMDRALEHLKPVCFRDNTVVLRATSGFRDYAEAFLMDEVGSLRGVELLVPPHDENWSQVDLGTLERVLRVTREQWTDVRGTRMPTRTTIARTFPGRQQTTQGFQIRYGTERVWSGDVEEIPVEYRNTEVQTMDRWGGPSLGASSPHGGSSNNLRPTWPLYRILLAIAMAVAGVWLLLALRRKRVVPVTLLLGLVGMVASCTGRNAMEMVGDRVFVRELAWNGRSATWKYSVRNILNETIGLRIASKTCTCIDAAITPEVLPPGETATVILTGPGGAALGPGQVLGGGVMIEAVVGGKRVCAETLTFEGRMAMNQGVKLMPSRLSVQRANNNSVEAEVLAVLAPETLTEDNLRASTSVGEILDTRWQCDSNGWRRGRLRLRFDGTWSGGSVVVTLRTVKAEWSGTVAVEVVD